MHQSRFLQKIKLLLIAFFALSLQYAQAQFPEGFEGATFPPAGWASFIGTNGLGTVENWEIATNDANTGSQSAFVEYEGVSGGLAEDWLVTPQFTPTANLDGLSIFHRQDFEDVEYGSIYSIRVSPASQTNHADFTIIETMTESDLLETFAEKVIDLSAYNFMPIYVAFVMEQDNGDSWYIDDVSQVQAPPCNNNSNWGTASAPIDGIPTLTTCTQAGDYVQVTGIQQGLQYRYSSTNSADYITVRNATNNGLLAFGVGPQTITALTTDDVEVHINLDDGTCGTSTTCREVLIECTTCVGYNNCLNAQEIFCGSELFSESTATSTDDNQASCGVGVGNWYKFTPSTTTAVNLRATPAATFDVAMSIFTTPDCLNFSLISAGCQDQQFTGTPENRDFVAMAGTTYYIYVGCQGFTCTDVGTYDLQLFCAQANYSCSTATVMNCGNNFTGETTVGAIRENPINPGGCTVGEGLWYKFSPATDGTATVTATPASNFDVQLSVLTSTSCGTYTAVPNGCVNTFQNGFVESLTYNYVSGTDYYFYAGNAQINQTDGTFDLSLTCDDGFCNNTTQFPNAAVSVPSESNTIVTISTGQWAGDYALITNVSSGEIYEFTNSASDLITIRDAVTKEVLAEGVAPLPHTALNSNNLEIHYNLNDGACGTQNTSRTTTVECLTCGCTSSYTQANGNRLTGSETGTVTYETDGNIESEQFIIGGAVVTYDALGEITLLPNFTAFQSVEFTIKNDGCSTTPFQGGDDSKSKIIIKEVIDEEALRRMELQKEK